MVRRIALVFATLLMLTLGLSVPSASAQGDYPPGPSIAAAIATDGSLLLNSGSFAGNITVEVGGEVVYSGPASDYAPVSDAAIVPGATVTITGTDADGNAVRSSTTIPVRQLPTATATAVPTPISTPVPGATVGPTALPVVTSTPVPVATSAPAPVLIVSPAAPVVVSPAAPAATHTAPALAVTGSSVSLPLVLGTLLVASGALAVLVSRRKTDVNV